MSQWITDWSLIDEESLYIVCPINAHEGGVLSLGQPAERAKGWYVKRLTERCYAALECPKFTGLTAKETT